MPGQFVPWVVEDPQQRQQVLDVGGFEELQAAELHERDVAPGQLELEAVGVVTGAEQHRLVPQRYPGLAVRQHAVAHEVGLRGLVEAGDEVGDRAIGTSGVGGAWGSAPWPRR